VKRACAFENMDCTSLRKSESFQAAFHVSIRLARMFSVTEAGHVREPRCSSLYELVKEVDVVVACFLTA
jgi:hypothetical protein